MWREISVQPLSAFRIFVRNFPLKTLSPEFETKHIWSISRQIQCKNHFRWDLGAFKSQVRLTNFVRCIECDSDYFDNVRPARGLTVKNHLSAILTPPSNWRYLWNIFMNNHVTFHLHSRFLVNQSVFSGHELKVTQPLYNIESILMRVQV